MSEECKACEGFGEVCNLHGAFSLCNCHCYCCGSEMEMCDVCNGEGTVSETSVEAEK